MKRKFVLQALLALAVVWSAVRAVQQAAVGSVPSAARLLAHLRGQPPDGGDRRTTLDRVISDYRQLGFVDKRALREPAAEGVFDSFLAGLTAEEKGHFVSEVLPGGFREFLDGFSRMPERDRQRSLERSRREILEHLGDSPARAMLEQATPQMLGQIAKGGLGPFFDALPPEARLQMLPFIEQMQNNLRQLDD